MGAFLAEKENGQTYHVDVPPDDYRSIRRAILDIDDFRKRKELPTQMDLGMFLHQPDKDTDVIL